MSRDGRPRPGRPPAGTGHPFGRAPHLARSARPTHRAHVTIPPHPPVRAIPALLSRAAMVASPTARPAPASRDRGGFSLRGADSSYARVYAPCKENAPRKVRQGPPRVPVTRPCLAQPRQPVPRGPSCAPCRTRALGPSPWPARLRVRPRGGAPSRVVSPRWLCVPRAPVAPSAPGYAPPHGSVMCFAPLADQSRALRRCLSLALHGPVRWLGVTPRVRSRRSWPGRPAAADCRPANVLLGAR
jgi:hypothetical protein